ncbi:hypothetical protein [Nocardioides panacisoli]|uniref:PRC-barrel domain containing protein n=1 Tax=Nocardioides panacisoli TaxID=627624 RepID=A0ABP7J7A9_9ACTN
MRDYEPPPHRGPLEPWPDTEYDAALHLLDRQIVARDGRLVGKVDDVELTVDPDGALVPTGLLVGGAALLPRFGGRLGSWLSARHEQIAVARADRTTPYVVDIGLVDGVSSEVHVSELREGLLARRTPDPEGPTRHRLGELLEMEVRMPAGSTGRSKVHVLDVKITPDAGTQHVSALVVGPGRPGSLLGYDRRDDQGPLLVAAVVRRLHRHARVVELGHDVDIVWATGEVRVGPGATIRPLRG